MSRPDERTLSRLRRSVQWTEAQGDVLTGPNRKPIAGRSGFWAAITAEPSAGEYSWKRLQSDGAGGLADDVSGATGTGTAHEVNDIAGLPAGTRVRLRFAGMTGGAPLYHFAAPLPPPPETGDHVLMSVDGVLQWVEMKTFVCPDPEE